MPGHRSQPSGELLHQMARPPTGLPTVSSGTPTMEGIYCILFFCCVMVVCMVLGIVENLQACDNYSSSDLPPLVLLSIFHSKLNGSCMEEDGACVFFVCLFYFFPRCTFPIESSRMEAVGAGVNNLLQDPSCFTAEREREREADGRNEKLNSFELFSC